ncbi:MAG TPA: hypothetical protein VF133_00935 [Terriglobales bacterium]
MAKRHFIAVYTDSGCPIACEHKHPNVATAAACISQPGGYVVAARGRKFEPLTESEEAQFQAAMYGLVHSPRTATAPHAALALKHS